MTGQTDSTPLTGDDAIYLDRVRRTFEHRRGEGMALTLDDLVRAVDFPSRRLAEAFMQIYWDRLGFVLVASSAGIFRPDTAAEINAYLASNRSRIRNIALRNRRTLRAALAERWRREGRLFLDRPKQAELFSN